MHFSALRSLCDVSQSLVIGENLLQKPNIHGHNMLKGAEVFAFIRSLPFPLQRTVLVLLPRPSSNCKQETDSAQDIQLEHSWQRNEFNCVKILKIEQHFLQAIFTSTKGVEYTNYFFKLCYTQQINCAKYGVC